MQLAIARIQNAKVTREVKASCFIYLHQTRW